MIPSELPRDEDELFAILLSDFGMSRDDAADFLSATPSQQEAMARGYRRSSWGRQPDRWALFLAIVNILVTVGGVVSGLAGAGSAVLALKAAL